MSMLKPDFVERRISSMPHIPSEWCVGSGHYYQLNLRMCQIRHLEYGFTWGRLNSSKKAQSILEEPRKIIQLDLSLNDLDSLDPKHLFEFSHLRLLNASLNRIERIPGVSSMKHLRHLDLSHNHIRILRGGDLEGCPSLTYLNLSTNQLESITTLPALGLLREVHLANNKLRSLEGIQALPQLQILHCQKNELTDVIALASSFRLQVLNVADNQISSLSITIDVLKALRRLQTLTLYGNPVDRDSHYQSKLVADTNVCVLDNVNIRPQPKDMTSIPIDSLVGIKEATQHAFMAHISEKRHTMEENVNFLQKRILAQQEEFRDYEEQALNDLEACLRYLDTLSVEEAKMYSSHWLHDKGPHRRHIPWDNKRPSHKDQPVGGTTDSPTIGHKYSKPDYTGVKETDEVLRHAYNELSREQPHLEW